MTEKKQIARTDGELIPGVCKAWNIDKGYGFCECDDGGEDIFMHQTAVQIAESRFRAILPGTRVVLTYTLRDGKGTAAVITGENGTPLPGFESKLIASQMIGRASGEPGSCMGKCKWFNAEKGFGFITPDDGSEDVFVNIKDVEGSQALTAEDPVQYVKAKQADNRDRATKVKSLKVPSMMSPPYFQNAYNPYGQPVVAQPFAFANSSFPAVGAGGAKHGTIKWYNEDRQFGFIVPSSGGTEVFFKGNAIQGGAQLTENDPVEYEEKHGDGKSWAANVVSLKNRKRKAPGPYDGGYEAAGAPSMYKAPRQAAYGQGQGVTQYDPYGNAVGQPQGGGGGPQYQQQYEAYAPAPQHGGRSGGYEQGPPQNNYYGAPPGPYY